MLSSRAAILRTVQQRVSAQTVRNSSTKESAWSSNNFDNFAENLRHNQEHAGGAAGFWKKLTFFGAVPLIAVTMVNAYLGHEKEHHTPRKEFVDYAHLRIRTKPYPWGDGNHSLFHNPAYNALPGTGFEAPDPALAHGHGDHGHDDKHH